MTDTEIKAADACCSACESAANSNEAAAPAISCSLGVGFKSRAEQIEALGRRALLSSQREALRLHLTYRKDALTDLHDLVAKETACCTFLDYDLRHNGDRVELTITAPDSAAAIIDELFDSFVAAEDRRMA